MRSMRGKAREIFQNSTGSLLFTNSLQPLVRGLANRGQDSASAISVSFSSVYDDLWGNFQSFPLTSRWERLGSSCKRICSI